MTDKEYDSQSYRMTTPADPKVPEDDFFDREAAYESWEERTGSEGASFRRYWVLLAILAIALIGIYIIYSALQPRENPIRLSQSAVVDTRIDDLELRLSSLEDDAAEANASADMNDEKEILERLSGRIDRLENSFKTWVEEMDAKKEAVQAKPVKRVVSEKKKPTAPAQSVKKAPAVSAKKEPQKPVAGTGRFHTVLPGENLYRISLKYNLSVDQLKELNNLSTHAIGVGQKLRVSP